MHKLGLGIGISFVPFWRQRVSVKRWRCLLAGLALAVLGVPDVTANAAARIEKPPALLAQIILPSPFVPPPRTNCRIERGPRICRTGQCPVPLVIACPDGSALVLGRDGWYRCEKLVCGR